MAEEVAFTAVGAAEASTAVVVADFVEVASAVVDAPHSVVAGGRTADRLAARIVGVELIAEGDSHRAALAGRRIAAAGSRHAALDLAADHLPARTAAVSAAPAASVAQAALRAPATPSRTADGIRSATVAVQ